MINSDYLKNLNNAQKEAVLYLDGQLLIVAGAGSGKTKVLTSRIAHIIKEKKAFPNQILSVTFTNKAAKEMQTRVSKMLGSAATGLSWLGTFHSICAKILRKHATAATLIMQGSKEARYRADTSILQHILCNLFPSHHSYHDELIVFGRR